MAAELAIGLARRLAMTLEPSDMPGYYWHYAQTPFEDGCYVLWELGAAMTLVETQSGFEGMTHPQYELAKRRRGEEAFAVYSFFEAPKTRASVLAYGELPDALFARLLDVYLKTACEYGPEGTQLYSGREPFTPALEFVQEIAAFIACGYAEECGNMIRWSDKIASAI
ncbi:hypothetical protein BRAO375_2730034 [Bradyrhizobium sp. ORS 375]|nr:hypothetical protein BRAO375_2730034 [Bradyrhizobium sp. ORS 375]